MSKRRKRVHTAPPQQQTPQPASVPPKTERKKAILAISFLLVLVVAGGAWAAFKWSQGNVVSASQATAPQAVVAAPSSQSSRAKVVVYYFHGTARCQSCTTIEVYTEETVKEAFATELKSSALEWKAVNVEKTETQHFIQDYKLYTKSVIVSEVVDGKERRWKNLTKVWELLHNEKTFKDYVKQEIAAYLKEQTS